MRLAYAGAAGAAALARRRNTYVTTATDYNGVDNYQSHAGDLTGCIDSKVFVFSEWFRLDGNDGSDMALLTIGSNSGAGNDRFSVVRTSANKMRVIAKDSTATTILFKLSTPTYLAGAGWHHIIASIDLAGVASWMRIDGVLVALDTDLRTDALIDFASGTNWQHAGYASNARWHGCASEVFFHEGIFLADTAENNLKFRTAAGKPADLGDNGEIPLGVIPRIYGPSGDLAGAGQKGSGGAFSTQGPALTACSTSPTD